MMPQEPTKQIQDVINIKLITPQAVISLNMSRRDDRHYVSDITQSDVNSTTYL